MQYAAIFLLLLTVLDPLLVTSKRVLLKDPRHVKRAYGLPWRQNQRRINYLKKPAYRSKGLHKESLYENANTFYGSGRVRFPKEPYPHGGDDFDQGHENTNHVVLPYGEGITHAISYGKGYIPYENIKDHFSLGNEQQDYRKEEFGHQDSVYEGASYPHTSEYNIPQGYHSEEPDSFYADGEDSKFVFQERALGRSKFENTNGNGQQNIILKSVQNSGIGPGDERKSPLETIESLKSSALVASKPSFSSGPDIKQGFVIRDSISLDDYNRKVQEFTKSWPGVSHFGGELSGLGTAGGFGSVKQTVDFPQQFSAKGFSGSSFPGASTWLKELAPGQPSYAVKEETMEEPHDFRTMPVRTAPIQPLALPLNYALPSFGQGLHG
ncbi:uncharacterized protein LOC107263427 [Cephus cinctus]|uniref:Uncharacterized protein LOC107263427 n=1 Tax=Cephus cinctus TaxID=211228 RepID=A0AAJ7R9M5_CEPCN|nr:uncharacterized protein LOC107263427 [Cephus cinctus]XP_024936614.1 uncharacterized protein LOC107263427 [Cephus cinctus]